MPGIFDQILDRYEKSEDEWRIFLYNIIDKVTRKSTLKKSLPSYIKEEDFLSETFLVMDEIARSANQLAGMAEELNTQLQQFKI